MTAQPQLTIRPVANGFIVEPFSNHANMAAMDSEKNVFNSASDMAKFIESFYALRPDAATEPKKKGRGFA